MAKFCMIRSCDYKVALELCKIGTDIDQRLLPRYDPELALSFARLADIYEQNGAIELSDEYFAKALKVDPSGNVMFPSSIIAAPGVIWFRCPWCNRRIWIYKIFDICKRSLCFRCLRQTLTCRR
ncbi:unnamed protein product [Rotaria sp. Silwood1]|nr:unnamed protein product [Rotaria sp. Silwood1]CAF3578822.1 unnamed protein product [Rotaria sp. Silwood1]CAF3656343.1 unnamed protein product [Rotaria sp. Silwood1]CAF4812412.1 unnamed protein product [Rotaria sp. Silwood1]CAF4900753.1 unnamed protein product [Rotaria sp. Silwood1]